MATTHTATRVIHRTRRPGLSGVPRAHVSELQRARMTAGLIEAIEADGYARVTVATVIGRARVSRKTFYDLFRDREDCFLAAFDETIVGVRQIAIDSYRQKPDWRRGTRAALEQLLLEMDAQPGRTRLCLVEALAAGPRVLERRAEVFAELTGALDAGRGLDKATGRAPTPLTAEALVGAVFSVLHARVQRDCDKSLVELLDPLMSMIVLPYLGPRAAQHELRGSTRSSDGSIASAVRPPLEADPLKGLNIRLTYRTVRVLMAIGEQPGASNREVAEGSGIVDQGQISKLLNRLAGLGLIENRGAGQPNGAANAWTLTTRGVSVRRGARPR